MKTMDELLAEIERRNANLARLAKSNNTIQTPGHDVPRLIDALRVLLDGIDEMDPIDGEREIYEARIAKILAGDSP